MALPEGGIQPHDPKKHNAGARLGLIVGGGALAVFLLIRGMSGSSSSSGVSSYQEQSDIASAVAAQQQQDASSYGYGATGGAAGTSADDTSAITQAIQQGFSGLSTTPATSTTQGAQLVVPPGGSVYDPTTGAMIPGQPAPSPAQSTTYITNGQAANGASAPSASPGFAQADAPYLAPGVTAPNYALTPPKGAPAGAKWSGPKSPGSTWKGIGGGWWVKK